MNTEQQRIELAKLDGWEEMWTDDRGNTRGFNLLYAADGKHRLVPDYLNDLNAVHELEKELQHYGAFVDEIAKVMKQPRGGVMLAHATAAQRCEAILRVKGIWK